MTSRDSYQQTISADDALATAIGHAVVSGNGHTWALIAAQLREAGLVAVRDGGGAYVLQPAPMAIPPSESEQS